VSLENLYLHVNCTISYNDGIQVDKAVPRSHYIGAHLISQHDNPRGSTSRDANDTTLHRNMEPGSPFIEVAHGNTRFDCWIDELHHGSAR